MSRGKKKPQLPVEDGPGVVTAKFILHRTEGCPGGNTIEEQDQCRGDTIENCEAFCCCEATCPLFDILVLVDSAHVICVEECQERCAPVVIDSQNAAASSMNAGASAGVAVAAIIAVIAIVGAAYHYGRKTKNGSGHVQVQPTISSCWFIPPCCASMIRAWARFPPS